MTRRNILFGAAVLACAAAFADGATPAIENVVIRQRWPWSGVVDIDFTVRGASTGVKFLARCEGMEEFQLAEKDLVGVDGALIGIGSQGGRQQADRQNDGRQQSCKALESAHGTFTYSF